MNLKRQITSVCKSIKSTCAGSRPQCQLWLTKALRFETKASFLQCCAHTTHSPNRKGLELMSLPVQQGKSDMCWHWGKIQTRIHFCCVICVFVTALVLCPWHLCVTVWTTSGWSGCGYLFNCTYIYLLLRTTPWCSLSLLSSFLSLLQVLLLFIPVSLLDYSLNSTGDDRWRCVITAQNISIVTQRNAPQFQRPTHATEKTSSPTWQHVHLLKNIHFTEHVQHLLNELH